MNKNILRVRAADRVKNFVSTVIGKRMKAEYLESKKLFDKALKKKQKGLK